MFSTRSSFLIALREDGNNSLWREFLNLYTPLIERTGRTAGLSIGDTEDVIQDVMMQMVTSLRNGAYDRDLGRFRAWLKTVAINKIRDQRRRNRTQATCLEHPEAVPDDESFERQWDGAFQKELVKYSLQAIQPEFRPRTWACFLKHGIHKLPAIAVSREVGVSENAVYVNTTRVMNRLREFCREHQ